jgi:autotransporter strand-loop-strand O-heptosyltransferase
MTNDTTSEIQKEILRRNSERDFLPRRGKIEENIPENVNMTTDTDMGGDKFFFNFLGAGPRLEVHGEVSDKRYQIRFFNRETGAMLKEFADVQVGEWVQADQEYYVPWIIQIESKDKDGKAEVKSFSIDLEDKNVFVAFESSALGDTIAWMPVIEEFRKKNKCKVIVSSFHNDMFKDIYPNILYVDRGVPLQGMQFSYKLGWFGSGHASNRNPYDCQSRNLQQIAMDILGIRYEEVGELRPQLKKSTAPRKIKQKYVVVTCCSTAQFKYWNFPSGWQETVNYLGRKGYQIVNIGKQPNFLHNVVNATGQLPMDDLINVLQNADFFIGLPSGLAWLNWALGKKTIMITGISEHFCEFQEDMYRVENISESGCPVKCFNVSGRKDDGTLDNVVKNKYTFDKGLWNFCPNFRDTPKHFLCTKTITPEMVKKKIALVEKHIKTKTDTILDRYGNLMNIKTGELICKHGE